MLVLSVRKGKLDVIKYFVSEQGVDINGKFTGIHVQAHTHAQVHSPPPPHTHTHVHVHIHTLTTAPVTKSEDSMLAVSVREGKLDVIEYFVSEHGVDINGKFTG